MRSHKAVIVFSIDQIYPVIEDLPLSRTVFRTGALDSALSNDWSAGDKETWKASLMFGLIKVDAH